MTSNLGASEMNALVSPRLGFAAGNSCEQSPTDVTDDKLNRKLVRSGIEAARRKFTPEFINRLDKIVVFKSLGFKEFWRILEIELDMARQRIRQAECYRPFVFHCH